jgi:hypothetical protein
VTNLALLLAVFASAATPDPAPDPEEPEQAVVSEARPPVRRGADAGMDQGFVAPTAFTQPARSVTVHDHELLLLGATFAPLDRWQITVAGVPAPMGPVGIASTKVRLLDVSRFHLATLGGVGILREEKFWYAGLAASVCLRADCEGAVSVYGLAGNHPRSFYEYRSVASMAGYLYGASLIVPVSPHVKLIGEVNLRGHGAIYEVEAEVIETVYPFLGVRLHADGLALTLGAMFPMEHRTVVDVPATVTTSAKTHEELELDEVVPAISASYRFGG